MVYDASIQTWTLDDGKKLSLRHIAPADAIKEQAFVRKLSTQSRYFRFHGSIKELNKKDLEKFTNPDPLNTEALIILYKGAESMTASCSTKTACHKCDEGATANRRFIC
jgi:acetyltransferase